MIGDPVCVVPAGDRCGEGPVWSTREQALYWTDINRFLIHRLDPANGCVKSWLFDEPVTALALTDRDDTLVAVLASRVLLWKPATDARLEHGFRLDGWPEVRLNDARPDPAGSLWLGSMQNNVGPDGAPGEISGNHGVLIRLDPDGRTTEWKREIGIANTLVWSPGHDRFYFADSLRNIIYEYDYDAARGAIANERPFVEGFPRGLPDGSAIDSEGYLWNCRFGGGCIVRIAPNGIVDRVIAMQTTNPTSCTFGGRDYRTLYITSASLGAGQGDRLAGSLFSVDVDVPGLEENSFSLP